MINKDCPFCQDVIPNLDPWDRVGDTYEVEPLNPVVEGHRLFIPSRHFEHDDVGATEALAKAVSYAHQYALFDDEADSFNLITSFGPDSTQTVPHIHVHYVPRRAGDGLALPWTALNK